MQNTWNDWPRLQPGDKQQGLLRVGPSRIPATAISGTASGKTVLITAGIHGCEYPGIQAVIELGREIDPAALTGGLLLLAPANVSGFRERLSELTAEDGKNLNRLFPGNPTGTPSDQVAAGLTALQVQADFYLDLHSGDLHEDLKPYVYYPGVADPEVVNAALEAAKVLDVDMRVKSGATTGAYNSAAVKGVPSLLIERGSKGVWTREEVDAYKKDILAVLAHLGMVSAGFAHPFIRPQREVSEASYLSSTHEGCWYPAVRVSQAVRKGDPLGRIGDLFGNTLAKYTADRNGEVFYMTVSLSVKESTPLIAYG